MGTNYYMHEEVCTCCNRSDRTLHIGKSSGGWCFFLHVIPKKGITTVEDWSKLFNNQNSRIHDEYGRHIEPPEMMSIITDRKEEKPVGAEFFNSNFAVPGPNNLVRSKIDGQHCVGHGPGTYDYIQGEFC